VESQKPKVVIIESDENKRYLYDIALEFQKLNVLTAATIKEGLAKIKEIQPDLIIVDEVVTDFHNFNLIEELEKCVPDKLPSIIVTNLRDVDTRSIEQHKIQQAFDYLADGENTVGNVIRSSRKAVDL
jgi:DNA-binding NtrC family response regulator